jgi:membrane protein YqaA with SNARE-associated domain
MSASVLSGVPAKPSASAAAAKHAVTRAHHTTMPHWLVHLGALGLFGVAILDSSPIPLPLPGSTDLLLLLLVAHRGNPVLLAAAAIVGSAIGGYLTWSAGWKGGEAVLRRSVPERFRARLEHWATDHSFMSVFVAALLPPPVPLTPFLLAAGALKVERNRFLIALTSSRIVRYGLITWAGATYGRQVVRLWTQNLAEWSSVITWTFLGLLAAAIVYGIWQFRRQKRLEAGERAFA